jgi:hypothetical protein
MAQEVLKRRAALSPSQQELTAEATPTTRAAPDETLVADARAGVMPAQMVEQKLSALLLLGSHVLPIRRTGREGDERRAPGQR